MAKESGMDSVGVGVRSRGLGWGNIRRVAPRLVALVAVMAMVLTAAVPVLGVTEQPSDYLVSGHGASSEAVVDAITEVGGAVGVRLDVIGGASARLTPSQAEALAASDAVLAVTPDTSVELSSARWSGGHRVDEGSLHRVTGPVLGAKWLWRRGVDGSGVDVALIDSGVAPVDGLDDPERVVNGPDISFDSQSENLLHLDLFGHGTHLASIVAGSDGESRRRKTGFQGVAPGARIVSVKVADAVGRADVSQVIAGIDWVVQHRRDNGLDVRVLLVAFGTDATQDYRLDPLAHAVENAWRHGIVVVVAAGNDGLSSPLRNPATDPYVISVGAVDTNRSATSRDDDVMSFSNCGTNTRSVDVLAPGRSILGLRVPGSYVDAVAPSAAVGDRLFRGTGTSQAAAVVAGAAALLVDHRPHLQPDEVKALLVESADRVRAPGACAGAGVVDVKRAARTRVSRDTAQSWETSTGLGSLHEARGTHLVYDGDAPLAGEVDIFGAPWDPDTWAGNSWSGNSWSGGTWNGNSWSNNSWSGNSWSGNSWSGNSWSGNSWSGNSWSGNSWSGNSWSGNSWSVFSWG